MCSHMACQVSACVVSPRICVDGRVGEGVGGRVGGYVPCFLPLVLSLVCLVTLWSP